MMDDLYVARMMVGHRMLEYQTPIRQHAIEWMTQQTKEADLMGEQVSRISLARVPMYSLSQGDMPEDVTLDWHGTRKKARWL